MRVIYTITAALIYFISLQAVGQEKLFSNVINKGTGHIIGPYISGDGNSIIFQTTYSQSGEPTLHHSTFDGRKWSEAAALPKEISLAKVNYIWGHSMNFDGSAIYFTSRRTGIGGYDISVSQRNGNEWSTPKNLGMPINSKQHDACPSVNVSEDEMYFVRCSGMSEMEATGCKIMYSQKVRGDWNDPVELPPSINTGNVIAPRILADNVTLIYASDKPGGKGGYDLYMTRKEGNNWSQPKALDYVNTKEDEIFTSMRFRGVLLLYSKKNGSEYKIYEKLIPDDSKPLAFAKLDFNLQSDYKNGGERLFIYDAESGEKLMEKRIGLGDNTAILNGGRKYNVIIQSAHGQRTFVSKIFDLKTLNRTTINKLDLSLLMPQQQRTLEVEGITFNPVQPFIGKYSEPVMENLTRLLKSNEGMRADIEVVMTNYQEDSIQSNEDLTELLVDSIITVYRKEVLPQYGNLEGDSATVVPSGLPIASSVEGRELRREVVYEDSIVATVKYTYHNDRTNIEGEALRSYLVGNGISSDRINIIGRREETQSLGKPERYLRINFN